MMAFLVLFVEKAGFCHKKPNITKLDYQCSLSNAYRLKNKGVNFNVRKYNNIVEFYPKYCR